MTRLHIGLEFSPLYWRWYLFFGPTMSEIWIGPIRMWVGGYDIAEHWND